ncbi:MAG: ABC transporter substrate-binding protein [Pseudomonadota bacterium]|nr:ABC transporter substrate-binding protein [Pseudomonadota bacterium]
MLRNRLLPAFAGLIGLAFAGAASAQNKYDTGATDKEIKIGQTMPYSGPASAYGTIGKTEQAYMKMINEQGGINARKINLISLDDGYSPPRAVEQVRKLVEQEQVLFLWQTLGTPSNSAIHKYVNQKKIPHLFLATGATKWGDPKNFPWTIGGQPAYQTEAHIYARYLLKIKPDAKIAVLYQNDDYGKDYLKGLKDGLGDKAAKMIVGEVSYEVTDPTVDSQVVTLKGTGADTMFHFSTPKFAAQAIRKVYDIGWRPLQFVNNVSAQVQSVLIPAGLEKSTGLLTALYLKDINDPQWAGSKDIKDYLAFMKKYYPDGDPKEYNNAYGYMQSSILIQALKQCGNDLTRENVMRQAANLKNVELPLLLPGIKVNTSPTDFYPLEQQMMAKFDGKEWKNFGDLLDK